MAADKDFSKLDLDKVKQEHDEAVARQDESFNDSLNEESPTPNQPAFEDESRRDEFTDLSQEQLNDLVKKFMDMAWEKTISNYQNSNQYRKAITEYMSIANELHQRMQGLNFLQQYAQRAASYLEELQIYEIEHKDYEDLGLSVIKTSKAQSVGMYRKLKYVARVLKEIDEHRSFTPAESRLKTFVDKALSLFERDSVVSEKDIGEAFYNLMQGPLSRSALSRDYPSRSPKDTMDWENLARDIRGGKLNDLLLFSRMAPFVDILVNEVF